MHQTAAFKVSAPHIPCHPEGLYPPHVFTSPTHFQACFVLWPDLWTPRWWWWPPTRWAAFPSWRQSSSLPVSAGHRWPPCSVALGAGRGRILCPPTRKRGSTSLVFWAPQAKKRKNVFVWFGRNFLPCLLELRGERRKKKEPTKIQWHQFMYSIGSKHCYFKVCRLKQSKQIWKQILLFKGNGIFSLCWFYLWLRLLPLTKKGFSECLPWYNKGIISSNESFGTHGWKAEEKKDL